MDPHRPSSDRLCLVADASVWINLAASGELEEVLDSLGGPAAIPQIALQELERGRANGHDAPRQVSALVEAGRVIALPLADADEALYLHLVAGSTADTLDDGEAATLALAVRLGVPAAIDERKATSIAARLFPALIVRSTTDLFFAALPDHGEGEGPLAEALFAALRGARMRVPSSLLAQVAAVLGPERLRLCPSLPASLREVRIRDQQGKIV